MDRSAAEYNPNLYHNKGMAHKIILHPETVHCRLTGIVPLLVFVLLVSGCSDDPGPIHNSGQEISVLSRIISGYDFQAGDKIGIYPVGYLNSQPGTPGDITYPLNMPMTYDGTGWKPETEDYLFSDEAVLDIYAYAPYDPELSNVPGKLDMRNYPMDFSVQQNQKAIDLLWIKTSVITQDTNIADLQFRHLFSKITIRLRMTGIGNRDISAEMYNVCATCTVNLTTGEVTTGTTTNVLTDIPVTERTADMVVLEAIVPPQSIVGTTPLFMFEIGELKTTYTTDRTLDIQQGVNYTFDLRIGNQVQP